MTEKVYRQNLLRLLEFWIAPILITTLIALFVFADYRTNASVNNIKLSFFIGLFVIFIGPFIWLYFDHFKKSRSTQLTFRESNMTFQIGNVSYIIPYDDIIEIVEYSLNRYGNSKLIWSDIIKWKIKTETSEFFISSLLISKTKLKEFIKADIEFRTTYFPTL